MLSEEDSTGHTRLKPAQPLTAFSLDVQVIASPHRHDWLLLVLWQQTVPVHELSGNDDADAPASHWHLSGAAASLQRKLMHLQLVPLLGKSVVAQQMPP